ncbi:MAG: hypothetical protein NC548_41755 [Lachnospiraceae bacterium]|nr:hypothetical protein [Lachnospiraceae bacterium]
MAKKDLAGLVGGIIGSNVRVVENPKPNETPSATTTEKKVQDIRATFVCNPDLIRKLKYIALADGRLHKDVVADAFAMYIANWEQSNGNITLPPTK